MQKSVYIFQKDWDLQIHTYNVALKLSSAGFNVKVFLNNCSEANLSLKNIENIEVHYFSPGRLHVVEKIINKLFFFIFKRKLFFSIIPNESVQKVVDLADTLLPVTLIGIEKKGLVWAGMVNEQLKGTLIYYSLELYENEPGWFEKNEFKAVRKLEIKYHQQANATIIQDTFRATNLIRYNNFPVTNMIYLPISLRENRNAHSTNDDENRRFIILYFGIITERRYAEKLASVATKITSNDLIWLHGPCDESYKNFLLEKYNSPSLRITNKLVPFHEIDNLISEANIGICFYRNNVVNDRLTAFSSEKVAQYLMKQIPIVAFKNESYDYLFSEFKCGIAINNMDELFSAIDTIKKNYTEYAQEAYKAYKKYYDFDVNVQSLIQYIEKDI